MDANGVFRLEATLQSGMGAIMTCRAWGLQVIVVAIRSCCKGGSAVGVCWGRDESKPLYNPFVSTSEVHVHFSCYHHWESLGVGMSQITEGLRRVAM